MAENSAGRGEKLRGAVGSRETLIDLCIAVGLIGLVPVLLLSGPVSLFLLASFVVAFTAHVLGMVPQIAWDGPGVTLLGLYFAGIGAAIVLL